MLRDVEEEMSHHAMLLSQLWEGPDNYPIEVFFGGVGGKRKFSDQGGIPKGQTGLFGFRALPKTKQTGAPTRVGAGNQQMDSKMQGRQQ